MMNQTDNEIWKILLDGKYVLDSYDYDNKIFSINIYLYDLVYLQNNYKTVTDINIYDRCFIIGCAFCFNCDILKFLNSVFKINDKFENSSGDNFLMISCRENKNLSIIKYLIEEMKISTKHTNNSGDNCLTVACWKNPNISVIKYLIENIRMNHKKTDCYGNTCLILACWQNPNIDIIEYLINLGISIDDVNANGNNCLTMCARYNTNIEIIKLLIEKYEMKVNHQDEYGNNSLISACQLNSNLDIIVYLINKCKTLINHLNFDKKNCFSVSFNNKNCTQIIIYLIQNTDIEINLNYLDYDMYVQILYSITNYYRLNEFFLHGIKKCEKKFISLYFNENNIKTLIKNYNPLMLNKSVREFANIKNPFDENFDDFIKIVDELYYHCPIIKNNTINIFKNDFVEKQNNEKNSKVLFKHNNINYYGDQKIVYEQILLFSEIKDHSDTNDNFELNIMIPQYVVNLYIKSCYTNQIDLNQIHPSNIINFIEFIDHYPTKTLSMNKLEINFIEYFDEHGIEYDDFIIKICLRYKLKNMYLHLHNQNYKLQRFK